MALDVSLSGMDATGAELWNFLPRLWDAWKIKEEFKSRFAPADPWPAWEGVLSMDEVTALRERYGKGQLVGLSGVELDLDELLKPPTAQVRLRIEEWGYG